MSALYAYALVDQRPGKDVQLGSGVARRPLSLVAVDGYFVVVEPTEALDMTPSKIVGHDRVVRRLSRRFPAVLPMRFGTTAPNRKALVDLVRPLGRELEDAFQRVRGAVQFTLRVTGPRRSPPAKATSGAGPGTRWLAQRLAAHRIPEVSCIQEETAPWIREERVDGRVTLAGKRGAPSGLGTVYHLVAGGDVRSWRRAVNRAMANLPSGVDVSVTGPWPPYAFVGAT